MYTHRLKLEKGITFPLQKCCIQSNTSDCEEKHQVNSINSLRWAECNLHPRIRQASQHCQFLDANNICDPLSAREGSQRCISCEQYLPRNTQLLLFHSSFFQILFWDYCNQLLKSLSLVALVIERNSSKFTCYKGKLLYQLHFWRVTDKGI